MEGGAYGGPPSDPVQSRTRLRLLDWKSVIRDELTRRAFCRALALLAVGPGVSACLSSTAKRQHSTDWRYYGGDQGCSRYSQLHEINTSNVADLKIAWVHHVGDKRDRPQTTIECTPIVVDGVMYLTTALLKVRALDAATGHLIWSFDPFETSGTTGIAGVNRGVTYWQSGHDKRILFVAGSNLYALNADTGRLTGGFGEGGVVDLRRGLDRDIGKLDYTVTSPGVIYEDLIILGSSMGEGPDPAAPGHVRAYDVRTGARAWIFHTIPFPGEFGHETWEGDSWKTAGGCNNWGGMSVDEKRGLVFVPLGSPTFDFYGGQRLGANLFGDSVVALNARTGERRWHFQTVHHDLWDYDLPCAPILLTIRHRGRDVDAVAQVTKTGMLFVFERDTGKPFFPVVERPVPASDVPGERTWPTQPFPSAPPPFAPQSLGENQLTDISGEARSYVLQQLQKDGPGHIFKPPSRATMIVVPGYHGGALWGGGSFNPNSGMLFVNSNNVPRLLRLVDAARDAGYPYESDGYRRFQDEQGYPAGKPPWAQLCALDVNAARIAWQVPLGEYKELAARGLAPTGTESIGGSIATAGGVIFIGATRDEKFRAFDQTTGKLLWEFQLESGAYATPATYEVDGRQYVVVAAGGGGKLRTRAGDAIVSFALA